MIQPKKTEIIIETAKKNMKANHDFENPD